MINKFPKINIFDNTEFEIWCKSLRVEKISSLYHPLIEQYCQERKDRMVRKKEKYIHELPITTQWNNNLKITVGKDNKSVLNIQVSDALLKRACLFLDYLFHVVKAIEGTVRVITDRDDNIIFEWPYVKVETQLLEIQVKQRDLEEKAKSMRPRYDKIYTGQLMLRFDLLDPKEKQQYTLQFQDNDCTIEEQIGDIVSGIGRILREQKTVYEEEDKIRQKKELEERIRLDKEIKLREQEWQEKKKVEEIKNRKVIIEQHMEKYQKIKLIEEYVTLLRNEQIEDRAKEKVLEDYCQFIEKLYIKDSFFDEVIDFMKIIHL